MGPGIVAHMPDTCVVGVDLGGTKMLAGAFDASLAVHHRSHRSVAGLEQSLLLDTVVDGVEEVLAASDTPVAAVGFGIPCTIDQRTGVAVQAVNLDIVDVPFRDVMAERLGLPVFIDNDGNVAALAEQRYGAARGASDVIALTIGTGIGGGLILGGEPYRGATGAGAELGHVVVDIDGPKCQGNCPNHGCIEAVASGTALGREARRVAAERPDSGLGRAAAEGREVTGALATELAHDGDAAALEVIEIIARRLGTAISSFVNVFNPQIVVLGGGVMAAGELLLAPARAEVASRALRPGRDQVEIVAAHFGPEAGMVGAAALALDAMEKGFG
jgi:glucokinase